MSELYRLIFRGEVLEGQHAAVVRRKLGQLLSIDEVRLDRLFSGQPVVVKADADAESAARYQGLFRKAGARLRVAPMPVQAADAAAPPAVAAKPSMAAPPAHLDAPAPALAPDTRADSGFDPELLPVGSDVLREDEREPWEPREIDTAHLALQAQDAPLPDSPPPPSPPDTSRLSLLDA